MRLELGERAAVGERGDLARRLGTALWRVRPVAVPLAYAIIAVAMVWPLPRYFTTHVPSGGDALLFLWNLWWFREAAEAGTSPYHTDYLYHPNGVSTVFTTLASLESALAVPLQWLGMSRVAAYNALLLFSAAAGAWAMFALARRVTGSYAAAFVAGLAYGWSPYHNARVVAGHLNLASHQWLPLYALAILGLLDAVWPGAAEDGWRAERTGPADAAGRRWRLTAQGRAFLWAALAGIAAAATAATEFTYAAFLILWTAFYLAYRAWPLLRDRAWGTLRAALGPLVAVGGLALVLASPLLVPALGEILRDTSGYMYSGPAETLIYSADAQSYLLPSELHPLAGDWLWRYSDAIATTPNQAERIVTLGWTVPLLGLLAVALNWRRRGTRFWGWAGLLAVVLSFGPVLRWGGRFVFTVFEASVLLPYAVLYKIPGFAVMRAPLRFAILASLAGAVLVAIALAAARARWPRAANAVTVAVALLIAFESLTTIVPTPVGRIDVAEALRRDPTPGAVLDLPAIPLLDYLWAQTQHERPIVGGYLARRPPDPFAEGNPALRYLDPQTSYTDDALVRDGAGLRSLQAAGIRYVVIHWWAVPKPEQEGLARKLGILFPDMRATEVPHEGTSYYTLPALPQARGRA